jgi:hypothetical protein
MGKYKYKALAVGLVLGVDACVGGLAWYLDGMLPGKDRATAYWVVFNLLVGIFTGCVYWVGLIAWLWDKKD